MNAPSSPVLGAPSKSDAPARSDAPANRSEDEPDPRWLDMVRQTQLRTFWKAVPSIAIGNTAMALLGAGFLHLALRRNDGWHWALVVATFSAVRFWFASRINDSKAKGLSHASLVSVSIVFSFLSSLLFGYFAVFLANATTAGIVLAITLATCVPTLGLVTAVYRTFALPFSFIVLFKFMLEGGVLGWTLATAVPLWVMTFSHFAEEFRKRDAHLQLRDLENRELLAKVKLEKERVTLAEELARAQNVAKSRFLMMLAHDVRQPLDGIQLWHSALGEVALGPDATKCLVSAELARKELSNMFDALLELSVLDNGELEVSPQPIPLDELLEGLKHNYDALAAARGVSFRVDAPTGIILRTDPRLLSRILRNLLTNAFDHIENGHVTLRFHIEQAAQAPSFHVIDTGRGIPQEDQESIFSEFFRGSSEAGTTPDREEPFHLGLGLYIVDRLCRKLNAQVTMESKENVGTRFSVLLPKESLFASSHAGENGQKAARALA